MHRVTFYYFAYNPPMALICGGILLLLLSTAFKEFSNWGWILVGLGIFLQILWMFFRGGAIRIR